MTQIDRGLPEQASVTFGQVFDASHAQASDVYMEFDPRPEPVLFFVGRNGSGKSRAAKAVSDSLNGRFLATDRLVGLMRFSNYGWGSAPTPYKGVPLADDEREQVRQISRTVGSATDELYAVRELPHVWLRVAAFLRRTLGRVIELRESAGFLDPFVRIGSTEYSLLRDEGHGLRELVVLLVAAYRGDWALLVVDEPELHMHPAMARLWLTELRHECVTTGGRAIVVTHEPSLLRPTDPEHLKAIFRFSASERPARVFDAVLSTQFDQVRGSLATNPTLVSDLMFSPRPVLVEGPHDTAALTTALARSHPAETVAQTDFVECGGSTGVAAWFEIGEKLNLGLKAVCDLDALFDGHVQQVMDRHAVVEDALRIDLAVQPAKTSVAIRPLIDYMNSINVAADPRSRGDALASIGATETGHLSRRAKVLAAWRDAGLWLHPQGTLENVLGLAKKGVAEARAAATVPGAIDDVASWCAYELDPMGDAEVLLGAAVEKIAHAVMEALRLDPSLELTAPVGSTALIDARLVRVEPLGNGIHRIVVLEPVAFAGYSIEFSRDTPARDLVLVPAPGVGALDGLLN